MKTFIKHKKELNEIITLFLLISVLFFYYIREMSFSLQYDLVFLLIFIISRKIRRYLISKDYLVISLILSLFLTISTYRTWIGNIVVLFLIFIRFFIIIKGFISLFQLIRDKDFENRKTEKGELFVFIEAFLAVAISLTLFWVINYFPSGVSPDTINQWDQIHGTIPFIDIVAPLHTLFLKFLLLIWENYAIAVVFNIVSISLLAGMFSKYLFRKGIKTEWLIILYVILAFSNKSAAYMYPFKDVPYTFIIGLITYLLMKFTDDEYKPRLMHGLLWGLLLTLCYYFRYNGIICTVIISIYLLCAFIKKRYYKQLIAFIVCVSLLPLVLNYLIYNVMGCEHKQNGYSMQVFGSGISAVVAQNGDITGEQLEMVDEILGVDWIIDHYDRWHTEKLIWADKSDPLYEESHGYSYTNLFVKGLAENKKEVIKIYFSLLIKNPVICLNDVLHNTYSIWGGGGSVTSNAFLMAILLSAIFVFWKRKIFIKQWIVLVPVLANVISIAISTITKETRYLLPTYTLFPPLVFYITAVRKEMAQKIKNLK